MTDEERDIKAEVAAITVVHDALAALSDEARVRVIAYVSEAFNLQQPRSLRSQAIPPIPVREPDVGQSAPTRGVDIRSLTDEKKPRSAVEMAAVVAYYLSELAAADERKEAIGTADLEKYFKQANFKLPGAISKVLNNAAAAGYFDSAGRGVHKLNPVGWNLVVHGLPAEGGAPRGGGDRKVVRKVSRKAVKKSSTSKVRKPGR